MSKKNNLIFPIIYERLPDYIRTEYDKFALLLKYYYQWLEEEGNFLHEALRFEKNTDIISMDDDYILKILNELGFPVNTKNIKILKRQLIYFLRDYFLSRGTENSFKFLFKVFYDSDVKIDYPRKHLIKSSSTLYNGKTFIFTTYKNYNTQFFKQLITNKEIQNNTILKGKRSGTETHIESLLELKHKEKNYLQICIFENNDDFLIGETIEFIYGNSKFTEIVIPTAEVIIEDGGSNYNEGDLVFVTSSKQIISGCYIVTKTKKSGINEIKIIDGGHSYSVGDLIYAKKSGIDDGGGFAAEVTKVNQNGSIEEIEILNHGRGFKHIPDLSIRTHIGVGAKLEIINSDIGKILELKPINPIVFDSVYYKPFNSQNTNNNDNESVDFNIMIDSKTGINAQLNIKLTTKFKEIKKFLNDSSILGKNSIITDSNFYQQFSYELISKTSSNEYKTIIDDVHPVGFIRFSTLEYENKNLLAPIENTTSYISKYFPINCDKAPFYETKLYVNENEADIDDISYITIKKVIYSRDLAICRNNKPKIKRINSLSINSTIDDNKFSPNLEYLPLDLPYPVINSCNSNCYVSEALSSYKKNTILINTPTDDLLGESLSNKEAYITTHQT